MAIASVEPTFVLKPLYKDPKQPSTNSLKTAFTSNKSHSKKEIFAPRSSVQRYAELPSLRYGSSPTPTAIQMMGSGPLRVSINVEPNGVLGLSKTRLRSARRSASFDGRIAAADGRIGNYRGILGSDSNGDGAPPAVRRVHFAELPPKFNRGDMRERKVGDEEGKVEKEEGTENRMRNRVGIPSTDGYSVSSNPRFERHCLASSASFPPQTKSDGFTLGNNGAIQGGTVFANKHVSRGHDTARYRHGTLTQAAPAATTTFPCLPPLVKAAREGDGDELAEILRKAAHFGISSEDLNATDNSGRTALSYIASNGDIKTLEGILRLPGVDVNKKDNEGNTALHFVAQAGQVEAIGYMISACHELDLDVRNTLGFTPLMKAAIQGRTKCAKLLLCAGASPVMRDSGRGLTAEQWARYCGRHLCADVIEKFSRSKVMDKSVDYSRWGSEPELAARLLGGKTPLSNTHQTSSTLSLKSKLRKAFRSTSHPGQEICSKSFSVVSQLTSAALCVSSPLLPSNHTGPSTAKSLVRPLAVPKVQVTLATFGDDNCNDICVAEQGAKERPVTPRPNIKKKQ